MTMTTTTTTTTPLQVGAQRSQHEDEGGQQQGVFSTQRREGGAALGELGGDFRLSPSSSPTFPGLSSNRSSVLREDGGGRGTIDFGDGVAAAGAGGVNARLLDQSIRYLPGSPASPVRAAGGTGATGMVPTSPTTVSAPSVPSRSGLRMGVGRPAVGGAPVSPASLSRAAGGAGATGIAPMSPATVSAPSIPHRPSAGQPLPSQLVVPTFHRSSTAVPGVVDGSDQQPWMANLGAPATASRGGRRKGQLKVQGKSCHGCRTTDPRQGVKHVCQGKDRRCHYWLCLKCMGKWGAACGYSSGWWCCLHGGKEWCLCNKR